MNETARALSECARALPPAEQLELADDILGSLDETDPALDKLWAQEAEDRLAAWRRGEIRASALDEVLRKCGRV
jgi:putative addiction module component (TIGR02574 family)